MAEAFNKCSCNSSKRIGPNIGRAVVVVSPMVVGMTISLYSYQSGNAFPAIIYVIDILANSILGFQELKGKELEQINICDCEALKKKNIDVLY